MSLSFRDFLLNEETANLDMKDKTDKETSEADDLESRKEKREKGKEVIKKLRNRRKDSK